MSFFTFKTSTPTGLDFAWNYVLFIHKIELIFLFFQQIVQKAPKKRKWADMVSAALTIQRSFRRYKARKAAEDLPDLKCTEVAAATVMIQKSYRGFQAKKRVKAIKKAKIEEDMPDLSCADVADAALKIQKVYRGFQSRKEIKSRKTTADDDLPDLKCQDVAQATIKIQKAYRGFKTRLVLYVLQNLWLHKQNFLLKSVNSNFTLAVLTKTLSGQDSLFVSFG